MSAPPLFSLDKAPIVELVTTASSEPVIDHLSESRLAEMMVDGHADALQTLLRANLRIAIDEAIRCRGRGEPQAVMVRRGLRALVGAAEGYRPDEHGAFSAHVRGAVRVALRTRGGAH